MTDSNSLLSSYEELVQNHANQFEPEIADLQQLVKARMMVKPTQVDQNCLAKKEIAQALYRLEYSDENLFLQGIRLYPDGASVGRC